MHDTLLAPSEALFLALVEEGQAAPGGLFNSFLVPMILIFGIMYLIVLRPESKKRKKREEMLGQLKKGDKVMTNSGMYAAVTQIQGEIVTLQVADGIRIRFNRAAVQDVLEDSSDSGDDSKSD